MLISYNCNATENEKSFEIELSQELQRLGINLWSSSISLGASGVIEDETDDKYGNTKFAIFVIDFEYIESNDFNTKLSKILKYPTINILFILHKYSKEEFNLWMKNHFPDLNANSKQVIYVDNLTLPKITNIAMRLSQIDTNSFNQKVPTGIEALDYLLNGGLEEGSSFNIIGPKGCGKTTLAVQIQKNILESGKGCLYITYSEQPYQILKKFDSLGCDIDKYIKEGKFRIYDSYSSLNKLNEKDVMQSVGKTRYESIIRVDDPTDSETYFNKQIEAIKQIGVGGINIIDSVNTRYELSKMQKSLNGETYKQHFTRFKAMAGGTLHHIGAHIVTSEIENDELIDHLTINEDGSIIMKIETETDGSQKMYLKVGMGLGRGDTRWHEYVINNSGIKII